MKGNIREVTLADFDGIYKIWVDGNAQTFSSDSIDMKMHKAHYVRSFKKLIRQQNHTFKIWGYFEKGALLGWMSVLPCRPGPFVNRHYGEISTYVAKEERNTGVGEKIGDHLMQYAREHTDLWHITTYISNKNKAAKALATRCGFRKIGKLPTSKKGTILPIVEVWAIGL